MYFISPLFLQKIIWIPTRFVLKFFGHLEMTGLENIKDIKSNIIFACNHTSELDPVLIPASLPFRSRQSPMFYVSREKKFYGASGWRRHFYGGLFFRLWGSYPVYVGLRDYGKSLAQHIKIVNDGFSICIFPEGRTTPNGVIQIAKGGVSYLSHVTNVPVVPVRIDGNFRLTLKDFILRKRTLRVIFGEPIYPIAGSIESVSIEVHKKHANNIINTVKNML
jgi:1-acyl-sn-glycerol-3-phosphate acyltransferase